MFFSIIPDLSDIDKTMELTKEYNVNWEYNDFAMPSVYDYPEKIKSIIDKYKAVSRDRIKDTMHGAFLGLDIAAVDPVLRDRSRQLCEQSMDIASKLGISGVVFHTGLIGTLRLQYYLDNWLYQAEEFYREMCSRNPFITVYLENSFEQEPDIFASISKRMSDVSNFKLCLDYGHAILTGSPIEEWVSSLAPYIGHMHINDNDLRDDLHLIPGKGKIDFAKWARLMNDNNINVSTLIELSGTANARQALEYINELI